MLNLENISNIPNKAKGSNRNISPIKSINVDEALLCGIKCSLDIDGLVIGNDAINRCLLNIIDSKTKNVGIPCIYINFSDDTDTPDLYIKFKNNKYNLKYILITNGTLHEFTKHNQREKKEIIFIFTIDPSLSASSNDYLLCVSIMANINSIYSQGSEFFSQIFDIFNKPNEFTGNYIKPHTNGSMIIKVDSNWNPSMLIPNNKSFVYYQGTLPFITGDKIIDNNNTVCTWIIFENNITILKETNDMVNKLLYINNSNITQLNVQKNNSNYPIYRYIDSKYREKLKPNDVVVKCSKIGKCQDGKVINETMGEIIKQNDDLPALNNDLNTCPNTLSGGEVTAIMNTHFTDKIPEIGELLIIISYIIISIVIGISAYYCAYTFFIKDYSKNRVIHLFEIIKGVFDNSNAIKTPLDAITNGGKSLDNHSLYLDQFNNNYRH